MGYCLKFIYSNPVEKENSQSLTASAQPDLAIFASMEKILLTGGAGYIGSHIAVALSDAGYKPVILDNFSRSESHIPDRINALCGMEVPLYRADCRDRQGIYDLLEAEGGLDGVIHLAAYKAVGESVKQPVAYFDNNIGAMTSLMEVIQREHIRHFVFSSSCTVYGEPEAQEVTETTPLGEAYSPYGFTKQACERLMSDMARAQPWLRQVSLRYFNPIGAHPSGKLGELPIGVPNNLVPYITQSAAGKRGPLTIFGDDYRTPDGTCVRDYIHVCDLARAHVMALEWVKKSDQLLEVFNVGAGRGYSVKEVVDLFREATGAELQVEQGPRRAGDVDAIFANTMKARETLGWSPQYTVKEALQHAWEWEKSLS